MFFLSFHPVPFPNTEGLHDASLYHSDGSLIHGDGGRAAVEISRSHPWQGERVSCHPLPNRPPQHVHSVIDTCDNAGERARGGKKNDDYGDGALIFRAAQSLLNGDSA